MLNFMHSVALLRLLYNICTLHYECILVQCIHIHDDALLSSFMLSPMHYECIIGTRRILFHFQPFTEIYIMLHSQELNALHYILLHMPRVRSTCLARVLDAGRFTTFLTLPCAVWILAIVKTGGGF